MSELRLSGVVRESIVDGPGIRFVLFLQGCPHDCAGCHNPDTHDPAGGYDSTTDKLLTEIQKNPLLAGVTLSGGEPFLQAAALAPFARHVHDMGLSVITYTGYTMEELLANLGDHDGWRALLEQTDILIDGRFLEEEKEFTLRFRGSKNQRILDPLASLRENCAVEKDF